MSVHVGDDLLREGHSFEAVIEGYPEWDLAAVKALTARELGQAVFRDPVADQLCHGIVSGNKPQRIARALAQEANTNWIINRNP